MAPHAEAAEPSARTARKPARALVWTLFTLSGATGLTYEILWLDELRLLLGSGSQATAVTLALFFFGMATGAAFWGRYTRRSGASLRSYAGLELGVASTALVYFYLLDVYIAGYEPLHAWVGDSPGWLTLVKVALAVSLLAPASFFMGGTLPVLAHAMTEPGRAGDRHVTALYAWNTLGAVLGAAAAGFVLPRWLGVDASYLCTVAVTTLLAAVGFFYGAQGRGARITPEVPTVSRAPTDFVPRMLGLRWVWGLSAASGALAIGLQVAWTRALALVFHNSTYTFTMILVVSIAAMTAGAWLVSWSVCRGMSPLRLCVAACCVAALGVAASPFIVVYASNGLQSLGAGQNFLLYVWDVFVLTALVLFVPGVALGSVFPAALALARPAAHEMGRVVGRATAYNAWSAAFAALFVGFVAIPSVGLWLTLWLSGLVYALLALGLAVAHAQQLPRYGSVVAALTALACMAAAFFELPRTQLAPPQTVHGRVIGGERLVELWEGSGATVAVVERGANRRLEVDNTFSLGSTQGVVDERRQASLPLNIHPDPQSIFFLGMGTGITAGAAVRHPVERVVVAELMPEVIAAARAHFSDYALGVFVDPRVAVVAEDGRNHLLGSGERYDLIIADLFFPWTAGAGSLYSVDHYRIARARLKPGGMYAQWLPLHQLGWPEFAIIVHTMLEAFPRVTLWRSDPSGTLQSAMLLGHSDGAPLDTRAMMMRGGVLLYERDEGWTTRSGEEGEIAVLAHYCGDLTAMSQVFARHPLNTDDHPIISRLAPISERERAVGAAPQFIGGPLRRVLLLLLQLRPPATDAYLRDTSEAGRAAVWRAHRRHVDALGFMEKRRR